MADRSCMHQQACCRQPCRLQLQLTLTSDSALSRYSWHSDGLKLTAAVCRAGGNPDSNTLISDSTTVICLDDYHSLDRYDARGMVCVQIVQCGHELSCRPALVTSWSPGAHLKPVLSRYGRKDKGVTALDSAAQDFDLMYEQISALKEGKSVEKPIYNHVTGLLDDPETIKAPKVSSTWTSGGRWPAWSPYLLAHSGWTLQ